MTAIQTERVFEIIQALAGGLVAAVRQPPPGLQQHYRQSDVPEIPELACVAAKGLLNRAHAYKSVMAANEANGEEPDESVVYGIYAAFATPAQRPVMRQAFRDGIAWATPSKGCLS